jgi:hypothetical protein
MMTPAMPAARSLIPPVEPVMKMRGTGPAGDAPAATNDAEGTGQPDQRRPTVAQPPGTQ